jgi:acylphosphatase
MIRRRVLVSGRVQGVGYRYTCQQVATERGVAGWVRNLGDGRVEAVFEGTVEQVDAMVEWARHGPGPSSVADIAVQTEPAEGLTEFVVR